MSDRSLGILLLVGFALVVLGCGLSPPGHAAKTARAKMQPTRTEIEKKLMGKTEAEVLKLMGRPDWTSPTMWLYPDAAFDPISQKPCDVWLHFREGEVKLVSW